MDSRVRRGLGLGFLEGLKDKKKKGGKISSSCSSAAV